MVKELHLLALTQCFDTASITTSLHKYYEEESFVDPPEQCPQPGRCGALRTFKECHTMLAQLDVQI